MKTIQLPQGWTLHLPSGFTPLPLPFFDTWIAALRAGMKATERLGSPEKGSCCLGHLCAILGRLGNAERFSDVGLQKDNPAFPLLGHGGILPWGAHCRTEADYERRDLAEINDDTDGFEVVIAVIENCFCQAQTE
jgi:hypothetical protein